MRRWILLATLAAVAQPLQTPSAAQSGGAGPAPVKVVASAYPLLAHLAGVEGDVHLDVAVSAAGSVQSVKVTSGVGLLNDPARAMISRWAFSPCRDSKANCLSPVTVHFVLEPGMCPSADCPTEFQFELPGTLTLRAEHRPAIVN
jgi:TonB family protein